MEGLDLRKIYRFYPVDPAPAANNLPVAGDIYYECLDCKGIVSSVPRIKSACACGNLSGADGKLEVKNAARVLVVRGRLK